MGQVRMAFPITRHSLDPNAILNAGVLFERESRASVRIIYDYFQMELTFETETRLCRHIVKNPRHKHGKHHYSVDALDFSESVERDRFRDYIYEFEVVTGV